MMEHKMDRPRRTVKRRLDFIVPSVDTLTKEEKRKLAKQKFLTKLKADGCFESYRDVQNQRAKERRKTQKKCMTEREAEAFRADGKRRQQEYRDRKREERKRLPQPPLPSDTPQLTVPKHIKVIDPAVAVDCRERNKHSQQKRRENMSGQQKRREKEKARNRYHEAKRNSTPLPFRFSQPQFVCLPPLSQPSPSSPLPIPPQLSKPSPGSTLFISPQLSQPPPSSPLPIPPQLGQPSPSSPLCIPSPLSQPSPSSPLCIPSPLSQPSPSSPLPIPPQLGQPSPSSPLCIPPLLGQPSPSSPLPIPIPPPFSHPLSSQQPPSSPPQPISNPSLPAPQNSSGHIPTPGAKRTKNYRIRKVLGSGLVVKLKGFIKGMCKKKANELRNAGIEYKSPSKPHPPDPDLVSVISQLNIARSKEALSAKKLIRNSLLQLGGQEAVKRYGLTATKSSPYKRKPSWRSELAKKYFLEKSIHLPSKKDVTKDLSTRKILDKSVISLHKQFKQEHGELVSRSTFFRKRPRNVLSFTKTPFRHCLCEVCLNPMLKVKVLSRFLSESERDCVRGVRDLVKLTLCRGEPVKCVDRECMSCGVWMLDNFVRCLDLSVDVKWTRWEKVQNGTSSRIDLCNREGSLGALVEELKSDLLKLPSHDFVQRWQLEQYSDLCSNVPDGWAVVTLDFAENYLCVKQDQPQSSYFGYTQVTVHPCVVYLRCPVCNARVTEDITFVMDCLDHNSKVVYLIMKRLLQYLSCKYPHLQHFVFFSDGCSAQYKSKMPFSFLKELSKHYSLERCFFGARHGKNPCDGLGGILKQAATLAVKNRHTVISNATQMVNFAKQNLLRGFDSEDGHPHAIRDYWIVSDNDITSCDVSSPDSRTLYGTRKLHSLRFSAGMRIRNLSCFCVACRSMNFQSCYNKGVVCRWYPESSWQGLQRSKVALQKQCSAVSSAELDEAFIEPCDATVDQVNLDASPDFSLNDAFIVHDVSVGSPVSPPLRVKPTVSPSLSVEPTVSPSLLVEPTVSPSLRVEPFISPPPVEPFISPSPRVESLVSAPPSCVESLVSAPPRVESLVSALPPCVEPPISALPLRVETPVSALPARVETSVSALPARVEPPIPAFPPRLEPLVSALPPCVEPPVSPPSSRDDFFADLIESFCECSDFQELRSLVSSVYSSLCMYPLPYSSTSYSAFECGGSIDPVSLMYRPDGLDDMYPVCVEPDGNCVPRSFSMLLFGDQHRHLEIRCRIVIESVMRKSHYLSLPERELHILKSISPCMRDSISETFEKEVLYICHPGIFMGVWQFMAASNALERKIVSIYPKKGHSDHKQLLDRLFKPIEETKITTVVMWSSTRNDMRDEYWVANHVVPMLPLQPGVDISFTFS